MRFCGFNCFTAKLAVPGRLPGQRSEAARAIGNMVRNGIASRPRQGLIPSEGTR